MKNLLYFAYGSNLLSSRLASRIGNAIFHSNYTLENYNLTFDCQGFANIQPSIGNTVEGCLYEITAEQLSELNHYEALYNAEFFDINPTTLAVVYVAKEYNVRRSLYMNNVLPAKAYLNIIIAGAEEKGLDNLVNKLINLRKQLSKEFEYKIFNKNKRKRK